MPEDMKKWLRLEDLPTNVKSVTLDILRKQMALHDLHIPERATKQVMLDALSDAIRSSQERPPQPPDEVLEDSSCSDDNDDAKLAPRRQRLSDSDDFDATDTGHDEMVDGKIAGEVHTAMSELALSGKEGLASDDIDCESSDGIIDLPEHGQLSIVDVMAAAGRMFYTSSTGVRTLAPGVRGALQQAVGADAGGLQPALVARCAIELGDIGRPGPFELAELVQQPPDVLLCDDVVQQTMCCTTKSRTPMALARDRITTLTQFLFGRDNVWKNGVCLPEADLKQFLHCAHLIAQFGHFQAKAIKDRTWTLPATDFGNLVNVNAFKATMALTGFLRDVVRKTWQAGSSKDVVRTIVRDWVAKAQDERGKKAISALMGVQVDSQAGYKTHKPFTVMDTERLPLEPSDLPQRWELINVERVLLLWVACRSLPHFDMFQCVEVRLRMWDMQEMQAFMRMRG